MTPNDRTTATTEIERMQRMLADKMFGVHTTTNPR